MKRFLFATLLCSTSFLSQAADIQCLSSKYDTYIDASLVWYQDLTRLTTEQHPELKEAGEWFLNGRKNHFELNRAAVQHYLKQDTSRVATTQPVETWLKLEQADVRQLATREDELGKLAATSYADRQSKPHPQNYQLRSAFADLLGNPDGIADILSNYNQAMATTNAINCP